MLGVLSENIHSKKQKRDQGNICVSECEASDITSFKHLLPTRTVRAGGIKTTTAVFRGKHKGGAKDGKGSEVPGDDSGDSSESNGGDSDDEDGDEEKEEEEEHEEEGRATEQAAEDEEEEEEEQEEQEEQEEELGEEGAGAAGRAAAGLPQTQFQQ